MVNGLPAVPSAVNDQAITAFVYLKRAGRFIGGVNETIRGAWKGGRSDLMNAGNVFFGDHQRVDRRLGIDVLDTQHIVIFEDDLAGNFAGQDLAEQAIRIRHHATPDRLMGNQAVFCSAAGGSAAGATAAVAASFAFLAFSTS